MQKLGLLWWAEGGTRQSVRLCVLEPSNLPKQDFDALEVQVAGDDIYFIEQIGIGDICSLAITESILSPFRNTLSHVPDNIFRICLDYYSLLILERI